MNTNKTYTCKGCKKELPASEYYKYDGRANKRMRYCKTCYRERDAACKERKRVLLAARAKKEAEQVAKVEDKGLPNPNLLVTKERKTKLAAVERALQGVNYEISHLQTTDRLEELVSKRNGLLIRKAQLENPVERAERVMSYKV